MVSRKRRIRAKWQNRTQSRHRMSIPTRKEKLNCKQSPYCSVLLLTSVRSSFDSIVEIVAGPEKRRLMVHKRLLCQNSPYFEAAFNGNFKEASENRLELPDESSDVAEEFVFWLYTGYLSKRIKFEKTEGRCSWHSLRIDPGYNPKGGFSNLALYGLTAKSD